jgi:hypothetical protein
MPGKRVCVDLTQLEPQVLIDGKEINQIFPSFCLPWVDGEPPLVGDAACRHRRCSASQAWGEARLDFSNRGRFHLCEGWIAMTTGPDSLGPANANFSWRPPMEKKIQAVGFVRVIRQILMPYRGEDVVLAMIVPDSLGPGPRQEIIDGLKSDFQQIYFVPRTIAAAMAWCESSHAYSLLDQAPRSDGDRVGHLLVTTTPADQWEAALVPIRVVVGNGDKCLKPIFDRVNSSSEIGVIGLGRTVLKGVAIESPNEFELWENWLMGSGRDLSEAFSTTQLLATEDAFRKYCSFSQSMKSGASHGVHDVLGQLSALPPDKFLGWVHVGDEKRGFARVTDELQDALGPPNEVMKPADMVQMGDWVLELVREGQVPYFEALAQLELYVLKKNRYRDSMDSWRELIEATEIAVGTRYRSPHPIDELSLPAGKAPEIDLYVRSQRKGASTTGYKRILQRTPEEHNVPVRILAEIRPGQGLARIEIKSRPPGGFYASIRESELEPGQAPDLKFSWPPGSAWVISEPELAAYAENEFARLLDSLDAGQGIIEATRMARKQINKWSRPSDLGVEVDALLYPQEIFPMFVYLGALPSGESKITSSLELILRKLQKAVALRLKSAPHREVSVLVQFSSWLYQYCPQSVLNLVREELESGGMISQSVIACAGNCFHSQDDYKLFFRSVHSAVQKDQVLPQYWLRAWRNLARFRHDCMSLEVVAEDVMEDLTMTYLQIFKAQQPEDNGKSHSPMLHGCYLAPQILKRRRYSGDFLSRGSELFRLFDDVLKFHIEGIKRIDRRTTNKRLANLECALKFLHEEADIHTLENLGNADS